MTEMIPFTNGEFELELRTHEIDGLHVLAPPLARSLGFREAYDLLRSIPVGEKGSELVRTPGGAQQVGYLTEAGFYRALGQRQAARIADESIRASVERFQSWVYAEVLPAIRKTGGYGQTVERLTPLEYARQLVAAEERAESERAARVEAEQHARALEAPASAWSHLAESAGDYAVADAAKVLSRDPNITIGRDRLFAYMAAEGWIYRDKALGAWKAYQTQVNLGRLVEKLGRPYLHEPTGAMRNPAPTIRITAKGLAELHKRLGGGEQQPLLAVAE